MYTLLSRMTTCQTMLNSLTVRGTLHINRYSYHACISFTVSGRNATVHDRKPYIKYLTQNRLLLNTCMDTNMQLTINRFRPLFPDNSLTFSKIPDNSLTAVKFHDISRFSRQVVTLIISSTDDTVECKHTLTCLQKVTAFVCKYKKLRHIANSQNITSAHGWNSTTVFWRPISPN